MNLEKLEKLASLAEKYDYKPDESHFNNLAAFVGVNSSLIADLCKEYTTLQREITNAQEAIKSAGIEADTVQAGVIELKAQRDALAAENAKLMSGFSFFMYSDESGFETFKTEAEAIDAANEMIGFCREDAASDGWPEETETIRWGVICQHAVACEYQKASEENGWMGWCDYKLSPETPATDAYLNAVRADAIESVVDVLTSSGALTVGDSIVEVVKLAERIRAGNAGKDGV